jgi:molecular chaperone DnaJ
MDLYSLLGVTPTASDADIERAYRRLARRYHPGVNPGDRVAEQAYDRIQAAYQVLTDADRRREYDRGGRAAGVPSEATVAFEGFDFSTPAEGPLAATFSELFADVFQRAARDATASAGGPDLEIPLRVSFLDALRGTDASVSVTRQVWCPTCAGDGQITRPALVCQTCAGDGQRRWARGHMVFSRTCEACVGTGVVGAEPCRTCRGAGVATRTEVLTVHVPAGTESGARLAVPGRGHAAPQGRAQGDLYVTVEVADHPYFRRQGRDVHVTLPIAVHEAALGGVVDVPTPAGPVRMRIPAGTPSGGLLRLREHGVRRGGRDEHADAGDLVVEIQIAVPATLDERSRALLREFGQRNDLTAMRRAFFDQ